jgi:uncharacterized protein involved in oxidation of intracellular sulfur
LFTQCGQPKPTQVQSDNSLGIVIYSNDAETVWNALRFANYSSGQGDSVSIFLLGKGVELENLVKSDTTIKEQSDKFLSNGGLIMGCGTCLKSRNTTDLQVCRLSSLKDLYAMVQKSKTVMTF